MSRIALGTASLGLAYGIANRTGKVAPEEAERILRYASGHGIRTLDTAIAYGDSESRLGEIGVEAFKVVTKLPALPEDERDVFGWIEQQAHSSLQRLRLERIYGLLLHAPAQLLTPIGPQLRAGLEEIKRQGLTEKIGVSIYSPVELEAIFPLFPVEMVQAPLNLVDRRLIDTGWLLRLRNAGVEIHARSVFLQGLLLMPREEIPARFARWSPLWEAWHGWLRQTGFSPQTACLNFARSFTEIDRIVVGVDSLWQLRELVDAEEVPSPGSWPAIGSADPDLINPSLWN